MNKQKLIRTLSVLTWGIFLLCLYMAMKIDFEVVEIPYVASILGYMLTQVFLSKEYIQDNKREEFEIKVLGIVFAGFMFAHYMAGVDTTLKTNKAILYYAGFFLALKWRYQLRLFLNNKFNPDKKQE